MPGIPSFLPSRARSLLVPARVRRRRATHRRRRAAPVLAIAARSLVPAAALAARPLVSATAVTRLVVGAVATRGPVVARPVVGAVARRGPVVARPALAGLTPAASIRWATAVVATGPVATGAGIPAVRLGNISNTTRPAFLAATAARPPSRSIPIPSRGGTVLIPVPRPRAPLPDQHCVDAKHIAVQLATIEECLGLDCLSLAPHLNVRKPQRKTGRLGQVDLGNLAVKPEDFLQVGSLDVAGQVLDVKRRW